MMLDPLKARSAQVESGEAADKSAELSAKYRLGKLRSASVDFEAVLVQEMFQSMEKTLQSGSMFGQGVSGSVYSSFLMQAVSHAMAETQSLGLARQMYDQTVEKNPELKNAQAEMLKNIPVDPHSIQQEDQAKTQAVSDGFKAIQHGIRYLGAGVPSAIAQKYSLPITPLEPSKIADIKIEESDKKVDGTPQTPENHP